MAFDYSGLATANEKLTGLADQVRNVTGKTSTLSIEGMTEALAALNLINYGTVKAGSTSIPATTQGDTLSLVAGTGIALTGDATNKKITISSSSSKNFSVTDKPINTTFTTSSTKFIYSSYGILVGSTSWTNSSGILALNPDSSFVNYQKGYCVSLGSISSFRNKIIKFYFYQYIDSTYDYANSLSIDMILSSSNIMYSKVLYIRYYNNTNVDRSTLHEYNNIDSISCAVFEDYRPIIFTNGSNLYYGTLSSSSFSAPSNTGGTPGISGFNLPDYSSSSSVNRYSFTVKCNIFDW